MNPENSRIKIISWLAGIVVILMISNILLERFDGGDGPKQPAADTLTVKTHFNSVLNEYDLNEEWVSSRLNKKNNVYEYNVKVPADVLPLFVIKDIHEKFSLDNYTVVSQEKEINGRSEIKVLKNGQLKLEASFKRDEDVRLKPCLSFIVRHEDASADNLGSYLDFPFEFEMILIPGEESKKLADSLTYHGINYSLLLNDSSGEPYEIEEGSAKQEISAVIKKTAKDFTNAVNFYYDSRSALAASPSFNFIVDEFKKNGRTPANIHSLSLLEPKADRDLVSLFRFWYRSMGPGESKTFLINYENFLKIEEELKRIRKKGYRFGC